MNICIDRAGVGITLANMVRKNAPRRVANVGMRLLPVVNGVPFPPAAPPAAAAADADAVNRDEAELDMCIGMKFGSSTAVVDDVDDGDEVLYGTSEARNIWYV